MIELPCKSVRIDIQMNGLYSLYIGELKPMDCVNKGKYDRIALQIS